MKTVSDKSVKFLLKDARATGPTLINLVFRYGNERFKTSTGQTILPYLWSVDRQRAITDAKQVKNKRDRETNETINAHLERYRSAFKTVLTRLQLAGIPFSNEVIKHHLDNALNRVKKAKPALSQTETFTQYIERFVEEASAGKRLNAKNAHFAPGTLMHFRKVGNILSRYEKMTGQTLNYDTFTLAFYERFKHHLTVKGHTLNYVGAILNAVKMLLKQAYRDGLHQNTDFQLRGFRKIEEEVDAIYLNDAELQTLNALDLTADPRIDRVRDLFLIGCYTGLRFSDYSQVRWANITAVATVAGGRILTVTTQKTGAKVSIPLNPNVLTILHKYDGETPRPMSNQKFNEYLKEVGQRAGLSEPVQRTRTKGGIRTTENAEKWELITTHTARRSFATNAFLAGVPTVSIMKITGHKSESQFMKYIKVTSEQNALLLLEHPHFAGKATVAAVMPLHKVA